MKLKLYEEFWGNKSENNDLEFDFLLAVGNFKKAINKVIEVHEKHYYNDSKITNSEDFQTELKSYIDTRLTGEGGLDEILDLVKYFENKLYNDSKFGIDSDSDYSMFGLFEDLTTSLWATVRDKSEKRIQHLNKTAQDILDKCDDSWVYQEDMTSAMGKASDALNNMDLSDIEDDEDDNPFIRWETPESLQKDIESYIGKKIEDFEYGNKLDAYKWVEDNCNGFIEENPSDFTDEDKIQVKAFLDALKDYFEL